MLAFSGVSGGRMTCCHCTCPKQNAEGLWLLEAQNCTTPGSFYCRVDQAFLSITISFNPCSKLVM